MIDNDKSQEVNSLWSVRFKYKPFRPFFGKEEGPTWERILHLRAPQGFLLVGGGGGLYYWNFTVNTYIYNEDKNESRNFILHT